MAMHVLGHDSKCSPYASCLKTTVFEEDVWGLNTINPNLSKLTRSIKLRYFGKRIFKNPQIFSNLIQAQLIYLRHPL